MKKRPNQFALGIFLSVIVVMVLRLVFGVYDEHKFWTEILLIVCAAIAVANWGAMWLMLAVFSFGLNIGLWPPLPNGLQYLQYGHIATVIGCIALVALVTWSVWYGFRSLIRHIIYI